MGIGSTHPDYDNQLERWRKNRDALAGQDAIHKGGRKYLPDDAEGSSALEAVQRYNRYLARATWTPVTTYTRDGLLGAAFLKPPAVELPEAMELLIENIDGAGRGIEQFAKYVVSEAISVGRVGLLVEYPLASTENRALMPRVVAYEAEAIDNWRFDYDATGNLVLLMVKLREPAQVWTDEFTVKSVMRYRVLRLNENGRYEQGLYDENGLLVGDLIEPRMADGSAWTHIPFYFVGANDNQPDVDVPLINGIVDLNLKHYRVAADLAKNLHIHSGGMLVISSALSVDEWVEANPNGITVGADQGLFLGESGNAQLLQLAPSSQSHVELETIREEMVAVGARLITRASGNQTAEAARIGASAETSALGNLVGNASMAIKMALADCALFAGQNPDELDFEINTVFFNETVDPQMLVAAMQLNDRQKLSDESLVGLMQKANLVDADIAPEDELDAAATNTVALDLPITLGGATE